MRTIDTIDRELHLLAAIRAALRDMGGVATTTTMDRLLDERLAASRLSNENGQKSARAALGLRLPDERARSQPYPPSDTA